MLLGFAGFAWGRGARTVEDLPGHVEAFVAASVVRRDACRRGGSGKQEPSKEFRGPVEQMLELVVPGYRGSGRSPASGKRAQHVEMQRRLMGS